MGYDLHITRSDDWVESASAPIGVGEWVAFARSSGALTETTDLNDGTGNPVFLLGTEAANSPALYWSDGRIVVRGADEVHVRALVSVAAGLSAGLIGDDGETYDDTNDPSPAPSLRRFKLFRRR